MTPNVNDCQAPGCIQRVIYRCTGCEALSCRRHCWRGDSRVLPDPEQDFHKHEWRKI